MKPTSKVTVYVRLLDEGVPVARPTFGEVIVDNIVRLLPTADYDPEDEHWEFPPGTLVLCEKRMSPDGSQEALLAVGRYNE